VAASPPQPERLRSRLRAPRAAARQGIAAGAAAQRTPAAGRAWRRDPGQEQSEPLILDKLARANSTPEGTTSASPSSACSRGTTTRTHRSARRRIGKTNGLFGKALTSSDRPEPRTAVPGPKQAEAAMSNGRHPDLTLFNCPIDCPRVGGCFWVKGGGGPRPLRSTAATPESRSWLLPKEPRSR